MRSEIKLPRGYAIEFGGQFENLREAQARLAIVVPAALLLIFVLIFMAFGSLRQTLLIYTGIPLAVTGGVFALWLRDMPFSISAAVGFIALSGVAVLNGVVMITYINQLARSWNRHAISCGRRFVDPASAGLNDSGSGSVWFYSDGAFDQCRCGGAKTAGNGSHRRDYQFNVSDAACVARTL